MNVLITIGSERLYSDLSRKFANRDPSETVNVIRLDKSGGCVDRSEEYMKAFRHAQVREYFFGHGENTLAPSSQLSDFDDLHIYQTSTRDGMMFHLVRIEEMSADRYEANNENALYRSGDADDVYYDPALSAATDLYTRITPTAAMQNHILAITTASPTDPQDVIRDSSVKGYIYVAEVDETKKKVRLLSPQPGNVPNNATVLGAWPEEVPGLVG